MDIILDAITASIDHLRAIDEVFSKGNYEEKAIYEKIKKDIIEQNSKVPDNKFSEELYVGGKKKNTKSNIGYDRQMILADIIEYIINGRGYFYAIKDRNAMKAYLKIILLLVNQLMIFDSITVDSELRRALLNELKQKIPNEILYKNNERQQEHEALTLLESPIGLPLNEPPVITKEILEKLGLEDTKEDRKIAQRRLATYLDSLLPKTVGLWGELLTYMYLLRKDYGFIFPLFLNQRLLSGNPEIFLKPPDLLLLPHGRNTFFGIEVGAGKEGQSGNFSIITGMPVVTKANMDNPKRCPICGKWMLFCPKVMEEYPDIDINVDVGSTIKCTTDCKLFKREEVLAGKCKFAMYKGGNPSSTIMSIKGGEYHFHLKCLLADINYKKGTEKISEKRIVSYYPYVGGLDGFESLQADPDIVKNNLAKLKDILAKQGREDTEDL